MLDPNSLPPASLDRMVRAVGKVRERLLRTAALLEAANIPYALIGGNAVAAWVSRVDEGAVRFNKDVDILVHRKDFPSVKEAMASAGFFEREGRFLDSPDDKIRTAVRVSVTTDDSISNAVVSPDGRFKHLDLPDLVRRELDGNRPVNGMNLRDLADVELIDSTWPARFPGELGLRLQAILDNPEG